MVLVSSVGKVSDYEPFQLAVLIICNQVQAGVECPKILHSMRVRIAQARVVPNLAVIRPLTPGSPGSDLNSVVRTDCMCSVKCAEATCNYKLGMPVH